MQKKWPFAAIAVIIIAFLIVPLPAKSSAQPQPVSSRSSDVRQSTTEPPTPTPTAGDKFDVTLSGGLSAHWQSSATAAPHCTIAGSKLDVVVPGSVGSAKYSLNVRQSPFTAGTYALSATGESDVKPPSAQLTVSSNPKAQWDLGNGGSGQGTITLTGGTGGSALNISIDGDLADLLGGAPIHINGSIACQPVVS